MNDPVNTGILSVVNGYLGIVISQDIINQAMISRKKCHHRAHGAHRKNCDVRREGEKNSKEYRFYVENSSIIIIIIIQGRLRDQMIHDTYYPQD
jgi:hypothetical protein